MVQNLIKVHLIRNNADQRLFFSDNHATDQILTNAVGHLFANYFIVRVLDVF